jgi:hypothetical protein
VTHCAAKEIWVLGADRWRDPDQDLPADYAARLVEHYRTPCASPLDPSQFVDELREQMRGELRALNDALPTLGWLEIAERRAGAIKLTALDAQPEPRNLRRVKTESCGAGAPSARRHVQGNRPASRLPGRRHIRDDRRQHPTRCPG